MSSHIPVSITSVPHVCIDQILLPCVHHARVTHTVSITNNRLITFAFHYAASIHILRVHLRRVHYAVIPHIPVSITAVSLMCRKPPCRVTHAVLTAARLPCRKPLHARPLLAVLPCRAGRRVTRKARSFSHHVRFCFTMLVLPAIMLSRRAQLRSVTIKPCQLRQAPATHAGSLLLMYYCVSTPCVRCGLDGTG
jgi:hypothetical protein